MHCKGGSILLVFIMEVTSDQELERRDSHHLVPKGDRCNPLLSLNGNAKIDFCILIGLQSSVKEYGNNGKIICNMVKE